MDEGGERRAQLIRQGLRAPRLPVDVDVDEKRSAAASVSALRKHDPRLPNLRRST
jgi:hypothetical protein